jgi:hypothetical protein
MAPLHGVGEGRISQVTCVGALKQLVQGRLIRANNVIRGDVEARAETAIDQQPHRFISGLSGNERLEETKMTWKRRCSIRIDEDVHTLTLVDGAWPPAEIISQWGSRVYPH